MDGVFRQQDRAVDQIRYIAVAIAEVDHDQRHTGVFYRVDESDPVEFLHLAWHCDLRRHTPSKKYLWVLPAISQRRLLQVAAKCDDIASANLTDGIPYSFGSPLNCFDSQTREFLLGPTTTGLTCASFVLALFEDSGLPLVDCKKWPPPNEEDRKWQKEEIYDALVKTERRRPGSVSKAHLDHVKNEIGSAARFRPEQVAAATLKRNRNPVKYKLVARWGKSILAVLRGEDFTVFFTWWEKLMQRIWNRN